MLTDYKFSHVIRNDEGFITEAGLRVYEGEFQDREVLDIETMQTVTRNQYIRLKRLTRDDLAYLDCDFKKELDGTDVCVFYPKQFGNIQTDEQLNAYLEVKSDPLRQKATWRP